jgi:hypothetical protein
MAGTQRPTGAGRLYIKRPVTLFQTAPLILTPHKGAALGSPGQVPSTTSVPSFCIPDLPSLSVMLPRR